MQTDTWTCRSRSPRAGARAHSGHCAGHRSRVPSSGGPWQISPGCPHSPSGHREVPRVPGWPSVGAHWAPCPVTAPLAAVRCWLARAGGGQQAYLPNDYNCLLGADSKLICFLVQGS